MASNPLTLSLPTLRTINIFSLFSFVFTNIVIGSSYAKPTLSDISDQHPTFFTPATWVVGLYWGIELLLLSGFLGVQYGDDLVEIVTDGIGLWFAAANFLISAWVYFWLNSHFTISYLIIMIQVLTLYTMMHGLRFYFHHKVMTSRRAFYLIYAPISLYTGWSLVDAVYSVFVAYTDNQHKSYGIAAIVAIWTIETIGAYVAHGKYLDPFFPLAVGLYFFGIALNQSYDTHPVLVISGYAAAGLLYLHAVIAGVRIVRTRYDYEPLQA